VRLRMSVVVASRLCERLTQGVLGKAFAGKGVCGDARKKNTVIGAGDDGLHWLNQNK